MKRHNKELTARARKLRSVKQATKEEKHLWYDFLRDYRPRFHRQETIGIYIVDFCCDQIKLVVELDGSQHYEPKQAEYDRIRTEYLNSLGYGVLRFPNGDVCAHFSGVCQSIAQTVQALETEQIEKRWRSVADRAKRGEEEEHLTCSRNNREERIL